MSQVKKKGRKVSLDNTLNIISFFHRGELDAWKNQCKWNLKIFLNHND